MKTTQTVELSETDLKEAIKEWLQKKFSDMNSDWNVSLKHYVSSSGYGWAEVDTHNFSAVAMREV